MPILENPQRTELFFEAAALSQIRNDVRIPGGADHVDFRRLIGSQPGAAFRISGVGRFDDDSGWRFVVAPLSFSGNGRLPGAKEFNGSTFAANLATRGGYRFDSYRLTYWRRVRSNERGDWRFGYTLKVRDAEVSLRQSGVYERSRNTGIVPLLYFGGSYDLGGGNSIVVDFDGLVAPQGSALDLGVFFRRKVTDSIGWMVGARGLYGGVDNAKTFNMAAIGYLTAGVSVRF